jgi:hypothetical protein
VSSGREDLEGLEHAQGFQLLVDGVRQIGLPKLQVNIDATKPGRQLSRSTGSALLI